MIVFGISIVLLVYIYLFKKHKEVLIYLPISKSRIYNLNERINQFEHKGSIYTLYMNMIMVSIAVIIMALLLNLNIFYILILIFISITLAPLIIIWNLNYKSYEMEFNNLSTYLTQFILVFKTHNKVLFAIEEVLDSLEGEVKINVKKMHTRLVNGDNLKDVLNEFNEIYPHFIVYNLHALALSVEKFGSDNYFEALDLIQDDIDDWIDDTNSYNYEKRNLIRKINILIAFAFGICYMALNMLMAVDLSTNTPVYQMTIFIFCFIQISTFVVSHSVLNMKFLHRSELVC